METLNSKVIDKLKECNYAANVHAYMKHIIVEFDANCGKEPDQIKKELKNLVQEHFPERNENLVFTISKSQNSESEFTVYKS